MICAHQIHKRFRNLEILRGASLEARAGCITLLTGANGSGKSTLLKILTGLISPTKGTARIGEYEITGNRRLAQRLISFLPQSVSFHPASTPVQILEFYSRLRGVSPKRGAGLLGDFGLKDAAKRPVSKLSGGMLQRLGLALIMLPDAPVLILDEPGLSLDPEWRGILRDTLRGEARRGKAILLTSHFAPEWEETMDAVFDCREGRIFSASAGEARAA